MYEVSDEYTEMMDDESSVLDVYVEVDFGDGAIILSGEQIEYIDFNERVNDNSNILTFGCACAHSVTIRLREPPHLRYKGLKCKPRTGIMMSNGEIEWVPLGTFWVDTAKTNDDYKTVTITAYDKMYYLTGAYTTSLVYPALFADVVREFETLSGVKVVEPQEFPNFYIQNKVEDGKYSLRDIAGHLAGCLGRNATFNRGYWDEENAVFTDSDMEFMYYVQTAVKAYENLQYLNGFEKLADNALKVDFLVTGQDGEIELENDGSDPGKLDWEEFDTPDAEDLPLFTFTYDTASLTASVALTPSHVNDEIDIKLPSLVRHEGYLYTVTSVPNAGFKNSKAKSITLSRRLEKIGDQSFGNCANIKSITIPESVTFVDNYAFVNCTGLQEVHWKPEAITSIGAWRYPVFAGCTALSRMVLEKGVKIAPRWLLRDHTTEIDVVLPDTLEQIYEAAFPYATGIKSINIPDSVITIGKEAFLGCTNLANVNFGTESKLETLGNYAFQDCPFQRFTLPESVKTIGGAAFYGCTNLLTIRVPSNVTSVGDHAFRNCTSLHSVYWAPTSMTVCGSHRYPTFLNCTALTNFYFVSGVVSVPQYILWAHATPIDIEFADSVTTICKEAFAYATGISEIDIPAGVQTLGEAAFYECTGLTSVTLHEGLVTLGKNSLQRCSSLTHIDIPNTVKTVGDGALYGCGLIELTVPASVTKVENSAFAGNPNLTTVYWNAAVSGCGSYQWPPFFECPSLSNLVFGDNITVVPTNLMCKVDGLVSVVIPDRITKIGTDAFNHCTNLTSIQVGESALCAIKTIGSNAFWHEGPINITIYAIAGSVSGSPWGASEGTINWMLV